MADVLTHIDTLDVEVAPQEELDITVGSPMEHSRVLSITENGKHVVSEYDLAEVDVQPLPKQDKVVEITENGVTEVIADDAHILGKVTINTDTTKQVMTDFVNNGGKFSYYTGTDMPNVDWDRVTITNADYMFNTMRIKHIYAKFLTCKTFNNIIIDTNLNYTQTIDLEMPIATSIYGLFSYRGSKSVESVIVRRLGENNETISGAIHLDYYPNLTKESLIAFFENLGVRTGNYSQPPITLGKGNYDKLTENDIKIATDKGWTVIQ